MNLYNQHQIKIILSQIEKAKREREENLSLFPPLLESPISDKHRVNASSVQLCLQVKCSFIDSYRKNENENISHLHRQ